LSNNKNDTKQPKKQNDLNENAEGVAETQKTLGFFNNKATD
jgi:hypothetical protein